MTLILTMANEDYTALVSDRRLTGNGTPYEDESNKAATLVCRDARLAVAFTGLAEAGPFVTRRWLLETLSSVAGPDHLMGPMVERLRERASRDVGDLQVARPRDKRLTVVLAGYNYAEDSPRPYCWMVSNFEQVDPDEPDQQDPWPDFKASFLRAKRPAEEDVALVLIAGTTSGVGNADVAELAALLRKHRPPVAIVGKAVEVLRSAASSPASHSLVGRQCTSIVLPKDLTLPAWSEYHTATLARKIYGTSYIEARGGEFGVWVVADPELWTPDSTGQPAVIGVPKVGRNQPCPCGSGRKYKRCHGRSRYDRASWAVGAGTQEAADNEG